MAYAYKRGKRWYIGWTDETGRERQEKTPCRTKAEAERDAQDLERRAFRRKHGLGDGEPEPMAFERLAEEYLATVAKAKRSSDTIHQRVRQHIIPAFREALAHTISPADIQKLLNRKREEGLEPGTLNHLRNHVSAIFRYGIEQLRALRGPNPVRAVPRVEVPEKSPKALPFEAIPAMLAAAPDEYRGIFAVAFFTGLRKGEILGLKVADVRLEERLIVVDRSYNNPTTKSGRGRVVPIIEELAPYLQLELGRSRSEWLFPNEDGKRRTKDCDLADIFKRTLTRAGLVVGFEHICRRCRRRERHPDDAQRKCKDCGMKLWASGVAQPFTFKDTRSTWGTLAYERTGDLRFVQKVLGHSRIEVTDRRYARFRPEHMLMQAAKLSQAPPYRALTNNSPRGGQTAEAEGETLDMTTTTAARSRGLEPLTSGVTGRGGLSVQVGLHRNPLAPAGLDAGASSALVRADWAESGSVPDPALTPSVETVSVAEAARLLGLSVARVYQLVDEGRLAHERRGTIRVLVAAVRAFRS